MARKPIFSILIENRVFKILSDTKKFPAKIHRQITLKIFSLQFDAMPQDCKQIGGGYRVDSGEYRILYTIDEKQNIVRVELVGSRNDDKVYKQAKRLGLL